MNIMQEIRMEKLTLNIGAGKDQVKLEKGMKLLKNITGINPVKTFTTKRIPEWGLSPCLPIGFKLTLRKAKMKEVISRLLDAKDYRLKESQFDNGGNIAFGLHEYIDIPDVKYDPEIGVMGLEVCITLERAGFRIKRRRKKRRKVPIKHRITKQNAMEFMIKEFKVKIGDEQNDL
jgi:large subunit ribosomal protein L5